jgi:hypothetical protein
VERTVPFVRNSFFAGESFIDLPDAQRRAVIWCQQRAGMRIHGTIQARPAEVIALEEQPALRQAPQDRYDLPLYATVKVHRDHHLEVGKRSVRCRGTWSGPTSRSARTASWSGCSRAGSW